jgi:hypothetical protein
MKRRREMGIMRPQSNLYLTIDIERVLNSVALARGEGLGSDYYAALEAVAAAFGITLRCPVRRMPQIRVLDAHRLLEEGTG